MAWTFMTVLTALGAFSCAAWIVRAIVTARGVRTRSVLAVDPAALAQRSKWPAITVVIAAKDEEENIGACVSSLLSQRHPAMRIIVADDRSTDQTGPILRSLVAENPDRLSVVTIRELPPGWKGKTHAVTRGVEQADGEWFLFTDADCRALSPWVLQAAIADAERTGADLLTFMPEVRVPTAWEKITQPTSTFSLMVWFQPNASNNPRNATVFGNGQFILIRRACYEAIGGHAAVRHHLNEDIHLARRAKQAGYATRVVAADGMYDTRMYGNARQAFFGWSRIYLGCLETRRRLAIATAALAFYSVLPWLALATVWLLVALSVVKIGAAVPAILLWTAAVALQPLAHIRYYRLFGLSPPWTLTYAIGSAWTLCAMGHALWKSITGGRVVWRGTTYSASDERAVAPVDHHPKQPLNVAPTRPDKALT